MDGNPVLETVHSIEQIAIEVMGFHLNHQLSSVLVAVFCERAQDGHQPDCKVQKKLGFRFHGYSGGSWTAAMGLLLSVDHFFTGSAYTPGNKNWFQEACSGVVMFFTANCV